MACYKPIVAWKPEDGGPLVFSEKKDHREIKISCGRCIGCRIRKREEWAVRMYCESKMHAHNHFITLTYDDDHIPSDYSLRYKDVQLFNRYVRRTLGSFRFFVAGEYGDQTLRPHYHLLAFGLDIPDLVKSNSVYATEAVYKSETIGRLWKHGVHSIGSVTYASARYCAAYICKKIGGDLAETHYERVSPVTGEIVHVEPEFARMSLKPGIGAGWLEKFWPDVYQREVNAIVINGTKKVVPKFFDRQMDLIAADVLDQESYRRYLEAVTNSENSTRERLEVREQVATAKSNFYKERYSHAL